MSKVRGEITIAVSYPGVHFHGWPWFGFRMMKRQIVFRVAFLREPAQTEETKSWKILSSQS